MIRNLKLNPPQEDCSILMIRIDDTGTRHYCLAEYEAVTESVADMTDAFYTPCRYAVEELTGEHFYIILNELIIG